MNQEKIQIVNTMSELTSSGSEPYFDKKYLRTVILGYNILDDRRDKINKLLNNINATSK